jgi:hypothetical protein
MTNQFYIPFINPVKFYDVGATFLNKYHTKHLDDAKFEDRLLPWQSDEVYEQIWQTDDIIYLQFESTFSPIVVELIDELGASIITLPALIGLPNKFIPGLFSFEVGLSLGGVTTGCYKIKITAGISGPNLKTFISGEQYISSTPLQNSLLIEYYNSRYHQDIIFETGIKFQFRCFGYLGFMDPGRSDVMYRDEKYNPSLLNSHIIRQWPVFFGNERGLPDETIDLVNRIWSCDNVKIDNKNFSIADGSKLEFTTESDYPMRGLKLTVEEGINRNSKIFDVTIDPNKKLVTSIIVEAKVFGDLSNQGSLNTVPVYNIE